MKRLLLVFAGLMVGMAHAQSVDWGRVRASCSSEASAYDAARNGPGDTSYQAIRFMETDAGSPPSAARLRAKIEEQRKILSDPYYANVPVFRLSATMVVCAANAALTQLQSGSTQSSTAVPSRQSQVNASASSSGRDRPDLAAHHCISRADNRLRNNCSQTIKVNFCTEDGGTYSSCGSNNLPFSIFNPGDSIYVSAPKAYWFACATPARPSEVEYLPGQGLRGACTE